MRNKYLVILFKKNKEDICLLVFFLQYIQYDWVILEC